MKLMQQPLVVLATITLLAGAALGGCGDDESTPPGGGFGAGGSGGTGAVGGSGGTGAVGGTGGSGGIGGSGGGTTGTRQTISGDATWTVSFDATAQGNGATNCSYTRHYEGVEDQSAPWYCPECEVIFRATVQMSAGQQDCFTQISEGEPNPVEWIGWGNGVWWRGFGMLGSDQGTAGVNGSTVDWTNQVQDLEAPVGGTMSFDVAGSFTLGSDDGDPMHGFTPPGTYACGWPKSDPAAYGGNYALSLGGEMPDGWFKDSCDEAVRLHDFQGDYLLVVMSAMDCPPCQSLANNEEQFVTDLAGQGITVRVITLLAPALDYPLDETTQNDLDSWIGSYSLTQPVLADRGWGLSMYVPVLGEDTSYPAWMLVDPDLNVLDYATGFGGFDEIEATIVADSN